VVAQHYDAMALHDEALHDDHHYLIRYERRRISFP